MEIINGGKSGKIRLKYKGLNEVLSVLKNWNAKFN